MPLPEPPWLVDLTDRAKFRLTGADRVRFLNGQVSNDVRRATESAAVYTCVMTLKGKMCADAFIHAGPDCLLLDAPGELRETLAARLDRYIIADDVLLEDVTDDFQLFHVIGGSDGVQATRFGRAGRDLWRNFGEACPPFAGLTATEAESLRVAAGVPRWGAELDENTMPAEAGLDERAVDFAKGCYIGQEVVSRIKSVGHVNWTLRGFRLLEGAVAPGLVFPAADGKPIARLTSVAPSLDGADLFALGYGRRGFDAPGTILDAGGARVQVCALPFLL